MCWWTTVAHSVRGASARSISSKRWSVCAALAYLALTPTTRSGSRQHSLGPEPPVSHDVRKDELRDDANRSIGALLMSSS